MKHWTVQKVVSIGFAAIILLSMAICGFSIYRLEELQTRSAELQNNQIPGMDLSEDMLDAVFQNDSCVLNLIHVTDPQKKAHYKMLIQGISNENDARADRREKLVDSPEESILFGATKTKRNDYMKACAEVLRLDADGKTQEAVAFYDANAVAALASYITSLNALKKNDNDHAEEHLNGISKAVKDTKTVLWGGTVVSLLVCILIAVMVVRMLAVALKNLMMALIQVNGSATEMAATLKEQQASANEVASTSMEIGSTAKEISATTKELGKTMSDVAGVSEQTAEIAAGGQTSLARLEATMGQIMGATASISGKLAILNEKTANINTMVTTINKVADQTNLLSLNAAIEAEKAGEYGQGFAVVATEIRRLADQTAVATYDIEQMVKEMQSAVSAGVMGMDKFAEEVRRGNEEVCGVTAQLVQIIQQVQALTPRFESVNEGMQMQSTAAGQISDALTQLGDTAQQSAQALRQNSEAIEQLMQAAQGLQVAASQLKSKD